MRNKGGSTFIQILKYGTVLLIIAYVAALVVFTSGSTKPFAEIEKSVEKTLDKKNLAKQNGQALKRYFGLNESDYAGVMYYSSEFSISAEEVLMIEAKNDSQVQGIKDAMEARISSRKNDFDGYAPKQVQLLENAQVKVRGKFVFFAVAPKAEAYSTAFAKSL